MSDKLPRVESHITLRDDENPNFIPMSMTLYNPYVINAWRIDAFTDEVVRVLPEDTSDEDRRTLRTGCVNAAHAANHFDPFEREGVKVLGTAIQRVAQLVGNDRFQAIYNSPPPTELIDYMLSDEYLKGSKYGKPPLDEITVEVARGRLEWDPRFTEAGVPTINEYKRKLGRQRAYMRLSQKITRPELYDLYDID